MLFWELWLKQLVNVGFSPLIFRLLVKLEVSELGVDFRQPH